MNSGRRSWLVYGGLILVGLLLGVQTHHAVESVLRSGSSSAASIRSGSEEDRALFEALTRKDAALAATPELVRDPFQTASSSVARTEVDDRWTVRRTTPILRALLHDGRHPVVQLQAGRGHSGWLGVGDVYDGWTIDEITAHSVRLSRRGASVVLASS